MPREVPNPYELHRSETVDLNPVRDRRADRIRELTEKVENLFPGDTEEMKSLREKIITSFEVPQYGDYHNEGMFMDSHLDLILQQIEAITRGDLPESITPDIRASFERTIARDRTLVEQYVFLHDISKMDCLTIQRGKEKQSVTWKEWQDMLGQNESGLQVLKGDGAALRTFCEEQGITGISYYHEKTEKNEGRKHGEEGVAEVAHHGFAGDPAMLAAIERHEVAYSFQNISVPTYDRYFSGLTPEARDFALTASFVDTMSSLKPNGTPDLANFLFLAQSKQKSESLRTLLEELLPTVDRLELAQALAELSKETGASEQLLKTIFTKADSTVFDIDTLTKAYLTLRKSGDTLPMEDLTSALERIKNDARTIRYDGEKIRNMASQLVSEGKLSSEELELLVEVATTTPKDVGKRFGPKMKLLRPVLDVAKI